MTQAELNSSCYLAVEEPLRDLRWLCEILELVAESTFEANRTTPGTAEEGKTLVALHELERLDWLATYVSRQAQTVQGVFDNGEAE